MTSEPFLQPRLTGERFAGGAIPLEVLADLAVLSEMVVEVAKWKYREASEKRRRVPRGFADGISLKLTGVEDGSARPIIKIVIAAGALFAPTAKQYFDEAKLAIIEAVGAAEQNKPITAYLPEKLLGYFNRFGRNLAEGEAIELNDTSSRAPVRLTKETRRKLILAAPAEELTEETSVYGLVHEFDQRARTFQLTLSTGAILSKIPVESQHYDAVLEASTGFREKLRVRVYGIGRFDRYNRLQEIEKVERVTILDPLDIQVRVDELKLLKSGWLDGAGIAPRHEELDWFAESFDKFYPDEIPLPYLFPTPGGGILAEWSLSPWALSLEIDLAKKTGEWHALHLDTDEEETRKINLMDSKDLEWLAEQIRRFDPELI